MPPFLQLTSAHNGEPVLVNMALVTDVRPGPTAPFGEIRGSVLALAVFTPAGEQVYIEVLESPPAVAALLQPASGN